MIEADRFKAAAICIIVLLFESINEICSRSSGCNLSLYFTAQFSVFSRYTKFCVSTLKSSYINYKTKETLSSTFTCSLNQTKKHCSLVRLKAKTYYYFQHSWDISYRQYTIIDTTLCYHSIPK